MSRVLSAFGINNSHHKSCSLVIRVFAAYEYNGLFIQGHSLLPMEPDRSLPLMMTIILLPLLLLLLLLLVSLPLSASDGASVLRRCVARRTR